MTGPELSVDGLKALMLLDEGVRLNCISRAARELVELGLAEPGWADDLVISEAGRRRARRGVRSEHVADLSLSVSTNPNVDPMASPHVEPFELAPERAISDIRENYESDVISELQRAQRAAGVASGMTGVWVDEKWVQAFVEAWVAPD
jgi:hypothetical protein